jgi:hypothetical protein
LTCPDATQTKTINPEFDIAAWDGTENGRDHYVKIFWQHATDGYLQLSQYTENNIKFNRTLHVAHVGSKMAGLRDTDGNWVIYQSDDGHRPQLKFERLDLEDVDVDSRGLVMGQ